MRGISRRHSTKALTFAIVALWLLAAAMLGCQHQRRHPLAYALETDDARGLKRRVDVPF